MTSPEMTRDDYYRNIIKNLKQDKQSIQKTIEYLNKDIDGIDCMIKQAEEEWDQEVKNNN